MWDATFLFIFAQANCFNHNDKKAVLAQCPIFAAIHHQLYFDADDGKGYPLLNNSAFISVKDHCTLAMICKIRLNFTLLPDHV